MSLFPTAVRYTGTSLTFNVAGILGASLAPLIAAHLSLTSERMKVMPGVFCREPTVELLND